MKIEPAEVKIPSAGALEGADGVGVKLVHLPQLGGEGLHHHAVEGELHIHTVFQIGELGGLAVQIDADAIVRKVNG